MNRDEFLGELREHRLLPEDRLRHVAGRFGTEVDTAFLSGALVADGALTPFQVQKILAGGADRLVLGQYRLLDELGRGGMGQVYKAFHSVMGRTVALKVLSPDLQGNERALTWFQREVRMLTQLQHPNIVLAYDANEVNGVHFLVMEYVDGQNLQSLIRKEGPLDVARACEMMFQAAMGLQYAHEKGVVHRDVKPANLLVPALAPADFATAFLPALGGDGEELRPRAPVVKIADFGLARLRSPDSAETIQLHSSNFAGTPDFVSPEQCLDVHAADIRSDLYSLGCTFFFALTGRVPFGGDSISAKLAGHLKEPPPPIERLRADLPPEVAAVVRRLMAKDPDDRFQVPIALARALQPLYTAPTAFPPAQAPEEMPSLLARLHADAPATALGAPAVPGAAARDTGATCLVPQRGENQGGEEGAGRAADAAVPDPDTAEVPGNQTEIVIPGGVDAASQRREAWEARAPLEEKPRQPARPQKEKVVGGGSVPLPPSPGPNDGPAKDGAAVAMLRAAWRQWTDLIAGRGRRDGPHYREVHERLVAACRRGADGGGERGAFFRQLEDMVKPWVSLEALERTEPEILRSLLARCKRVEEALGVRRPWEWLGRLSPFGAAAALIGLLFFLAGKVDWRPWSALATGAGRPGWRSLLVSLHLDAPEGMASAVLVVILLTAVVLLFRRRS